MTVFLEIAVLVNYYRQLKIDYGDKMLIDQMCNFTKSSICIAMLLIYFRTLFLVDRVLRPSPRGADWKRNFGSGQRGKHRRQTQSLYRLYRQTVQTEHRRVNNSDQGGPTLHSAFRYQTEGSTQKRLERGDQTANRSCTSYYSYLSCLSPPAQKVHIVICHDLQLRS